MARDTWRVVAYLDTPLRRLPPALDGILLHARIRQMNAAERPWRTDETAMDSLPLPVVRGQMGGLRHIPRVSAACYGSWPADGDWIAEAAAGPLAYDPERAAVLTWFAVGHGEGIERMLRDVRQLDSDRRSRHGIVDRWEVEPWPEDWSWTAHLGAVDGAGRPLPHLMRVLPDTPLSGLRCCGERRTRARYRPPYAVSQAVPCLAPTWSVIEAWPEVE